MNVIVRTRKTASLCSLIVMMCASLTLLSACNEDKPTQPPDAEPEDTTSHDFTWEIKYFDNAEFYDVFAINDSDVWVVGQLLLSDSTGQLDYSNPMNAVHWDGKEWTIQRIPSVNSSGQNIKTKIFSIFAFNSNDIWALSYGGSYAHWNGRDWTSKYIKDTDGGLLRIFGFSKNDIYFAGVNGAITHWNGFMFNKMSTGFKAPYGVTDLWGVESNGEKEVWAVLQVTHQNRSALLQFTGTTQRWSTVWSNEYKVGMEQPYSGVLTSIYPYSKECYFLTSSVPYISKPVYEKRPTFGSNARLLVSNLYSAWPFRVRGIDRNDVLIVGDRMLVAHYNGRSWRLYSELSEGNAIPLWGLSMINNSVFAVGTDAVTGVIVHGKRVK